MFTFTRIIFGNQHRQGQADVVCEKKIKSVASFSYFPLIHNVIHIIHPVENNQIILFWQNYVRLSLKLVIDCLFLFLPSFLNSTFCYILCSYRYLLFQFLGYLYKGQLNSEWIYEVSVFSKIPTKNYRDFCPTFW